jgi:internalin A
MEGDWAGAARIAKVSRTQFKTEIALATHEALSLLALEDNDGAQRALTSFQNFTLADGSVTGWLEALIELCRGRKEDAQRSLEIYLGRPVNTGSELNQAFLLRLWDEQETIPHGNRLCFNLPVLPPSLTGLAGPVWRLQFSEPVLRERVSAVRQAKPVRQAIVPTIYVSYAWGEDETPNGRRREEIVDLLCQAVRDSGREIGRDRERMKSGASIDRFAKEISSAHRIIAVMSDKSLHSEYCMVRELFRAYKRCEFDRADFQEKVIAIMTEDARPYLRGHSAWTELARHWQERIQRKRQDLLDIDRERRNQDLWQFADLEAEMAERLQGMIEALIDVIMPREFEDIVENEFQDVLSRLP